MDYLLLVISLPIIYFSTKSVIRRYNNHASFKEQQIYYSDVLGMLCGIGLFIVYLLQILGFSIH